MLVLRDFRDFVTRGSVVELAVAVVVAVALVALLKSLVVDVVTPLVGVAGGLDPSALSRDPARVADPLRRVPQRAAVLPADRGRRVLRVVKPLGAYQRRTQGAVPAVATAVCPRCLSTVPAAASRCPFCTSELHPVG
jgi:large conductance mechanosensitive channel